MPPSAALHVSLTYVHRDVGILPVSLPCSVQAGEEASVKSEWLGRCFSIKPIYGYVCRESLLPREGMGKEVGANGKFPCTNSLDTAYQRET